MIHMQINVKEVEFVVGDEEILNRIQDVKSLPMFTDKMMGFLEELSRRLLHCKEAKEYQDIMAYGYWIRKASLEKEKKKYDLRGRIGRGVSFHIAPSNVPVNFAVSMTSAVLAGNACIIRLSEKHFAQVDIITGIMNELLQTDFKELQPYFCLLRYKHDIEVTQFLSQKADIRIVWGGDETICAIRKACLPERTIEMTFPDRYSVLLMNTSNCLNDDIEDIARKFYTDTYYSDQGACSSPRIICWFGNDIYQAKQRFWEAVDKVVETKYNMKSVQAIDKYTEMCLVSMCKNDCNPRIVSKDNKIVRISVDKVDEALMNYKFGGGYFYEYNASSLDDVLPLFGKKCQTVSVCGIDKKSVLEYVMNRGVKGVDRIVNLGDTMGLEFVWDGFKMIETMTRMIYVGD